MRTMHRVAVIGAGVMGAGIAAQVANAGVPCLLLDIVPKDAGEDRSRIAKAARQRLLKTDPAPLMHKKNITLIETGNIEDDLARLADCDWIIEAIVENPAIKQDLYRRIDAVRRPGAIVSSNTSTLPLAKLTEGLPDRFVEDFFITHFFNPPRYMRLLEIVAGPRSDARSLRRLQSFAEVSLGKGVVLCKDTPGFIANRLGIYWLQCSVVQALELGITVEEADSVIARPMGIPKTGVFGLLDMVGLDLMPQVLTSMAESLPPEDPFHEIYREPELIKKMIAEGYTGRKGKGGFYRLKPDSKEKIKEAINLISGDYAKAKRPKLKSVAASKKGGLKALLAHPDKGGRFAWSVMARTLCYAAGLVPEAADDIADIDEAMRLGYNWKYGPFELIDQLGPAWFRAQLEEHGLKVPPLLDEVGAGSFYRTRAGFLEVYAGGGEYRKLERGPGVLLLADIKRRKQPLARNWSASLWDIGDGVACLEFHSRMNSLNPLSLRMIAQSIRIVREGYKALVIYNEGSNFSVGANIFFVSIAARFRAWFIVEHILRKGQERYQELKQAPFPVVAAPSGMALGGGCEVLLHSDAVQAHAETYAGLVETAVGFIPGWGGCKEMLWRWADAQDRPGGPMPPIIKVFETIGMAKVAKSATEARELRFLRASDRISMNRDRLLADAKALALELAVDYQVPQEHDIILPGPTAKAAMALAIDNLRLSGKATPHDAVVAKQLAEVLSGGATDITESLTPAQLLALERKVFMVLVRKPATIARVRHMLKTGKPLRN